MVLWEVLPALAVLFVGFIAYARICFRYPPALVLAVVAYSMITKSASVAYLERVDVYLIEVGIFSYYLGATPRQIFYNLFIFVIALTIIHQVIAWQKPAITMHLDCFGNSECNRELRLALAVSAVLLGAQILNAILSPPYALPGVGVGRIQFWSDIKFPELADLFGVLVIFVPAIVGVSLAYGKITNQSYFRRFGLMLMLAYAGYFTLTGASFNGWLMASLFCLGPYWIVLWAFGRRLHVKRMGLLAILAVSIFLVVGYSDIADRGIATREGSTWNALLYRAFALQGNVYFAADVQASGGDRHSPTLLLESMASTVQAYMPLGMSEAYIDRKVNLAGSLPGNSIFVYGYWIGLAPMTIYAILLGLIGSFFVYIIVTGRFLSIMPGAYLSLWANNSYAQGSFGPLLDVKFFLFLGLVILWLLFERSLKQNRRTHVQRRVTHSTMLT